MNLIWAFIQNKFFSQPIKYCQKTCYGAITQSSRTEKFMVDFLPICGATGTCCDKTHKSMTSI